MSGCAEQRNQLFTTFDKDIELTNQTMEIDLESRAILEGKPRVQYQANRLGSLDDFFKLHPPLASQYDKMCNVIKMHVRDMEECGVTPVLPDGKTAGNVGALLSTRNQQFLVVTKTGKAPHKEMDTKKDFTIINSFDKNSWSCDYYSYDEKVMPTGDVPVIFLTLNKFSELGWNDQPKYLHGHAIANERDSRKFGFPITLEEKMSSTPEDAKTLFDLLEKFPFPKNKVFIRKGHGFVLIGKSAEDAWQTFQQKVKPYL